MRSRLVLLVVAILLVAGFAALNWPEVMRTSPLLFGPIVAEAPMGAILLGLLALAVVAFVLSAGSIRTRSLMESRHHYKELEAQRALADKAEASRFTELRTYLDENLRDLRERNAMFNTEWQRELRSQNEVTNRMLAARLNELEHRLETRFERMGGGRGAAVPPLAAADTMRHEPVRSEPLRNEPLRNEPVRNEPVRNEVVHPREHAMAEEARQAQMRQEERLRDERIREQADIRRDERAPDRPTEPTGWRRWF